MENKQFSDKYIVDRLEKISELVEQINNACIVNDVCDNNCERKDGYTCPFQLYKDACIINEIEDCLKVAHDSFETIEADERRKVLKSIINNYKQIKK